MIDRRPIPAIFAALFLFTISVIGQDKLQPLPADASLTDGQTWLQKELPKNFGYTTIGDSVRVSKFKIEDCKMSYRVLQDYTDEKSVLGDKPALGQTGAVTASDISYSVHEDVSVDLKDIDPGVVGLGQLPTPKGMQAISLQTHGKQDLIKFDREGSKVRYNATGARSSTVLPVKDTAGESLARALLRVIQQCQAK